MNFSGLQEVWPTDWATGRRHKETIFGRGEACGHAA